MLLIKRSVAEVVVVSTVGMLEQTYLRYAVSLFVLPHPQLHRAMKPEDAYLQCAMFPARVHVMTQ